MKVSKIAAWVLVATMAGSGVVAEAKTRKQDMSAKETFKPADAVAGQVYVTAAMTTPMLDLLKKADVQHPDIMLEYGIALDLGRPSVSSSLAPGDKEKLKAGFRAMLDLYLDSGDKFDIQFDEDAMLDESEFWIYLAKHVGRPKQRIDATIATGATGTMPGENGATNFFMTDMNDQNNSLNLNQDLILKGPVVNAATTCAQSAFGFARMKKAQLVDISQTKLTPDQFAKVQATAVRVYRLSYSEGQLACGSRDYFMKAADFASQNLGSLGTMQENPAAVLAELSDVVVDPDAEPADKK